MRTVAYWNVVDSLTVCVHTTRTPARVYALVVDTGLLCGTVTVQYTLRPAADVRVAERARATHTRHHAMTLHALRVRATLRALARVRLIYHICRIQE